MKSFYSIFIFFISLKMAQAQLANPYFINNYDKVTALYADENSLWVGTTEGLIQRNLSDMKITAVYNFSTEPLISGRIMDMSLDPLGKLWIRTDVPSLYKLTETGFNYESVGSNEALGIAFRSNGTRLTETKQATVSPFGGNLIYKGFWRLISSGDGKVNYALTCDNNCVGSPSGAGCYTYLNGIKRMTSNGWQDVVTINEETGLRTKVHPTDSSLWWIKGNGFKVLRNSTIETVTMPESVIDFSFLPDGTLYFLGSSRRVFRYQNNIVVPITLGNTNNAISAFTLSPSGKIFTGSRANTYNNYTSNQINGLYEWQDSTWKYYVGAIATEENDQVYNYKGEDWLMSPSQISVFSSDTTYRYLLDYQPLPQFLKVKYEDDAGRLWFISTNPNQLQLGQQQFWKYEDHTWTRFDTSNTELLSFNLSQTWSDSLGNTWFKYNSNNLSSKVVRYNGNTFTNFSTYDSLLLSPAFKKNWWVIENNILVKYSTTNERTTFPLPTGIGNTTPTGQVSYYFSNKDGIVWAAQYLNIYPSFPEQPINIFKFNGTQWITIITDLYYYKYFVGIYPHDDWALFLTNGQTQEFGPIPYLCFMNGTAGSVVNTNFFTDLIPNNGCWATAYIQPAVYNNEYYLAFDYSKRSSSFSVPPPIYWTKSGLIKVNSTGVISTVSNTNPHITPDNLGNWWFLDDLKTATNKPLTSVPFFQITDNFCNEGKGFAAILHGKRQKGTYLWSNGSIKSANYGLSSGVTHHVNVKHDTHTFDRDLYMGGISPLSATVTSDIPTNNTNNGSISLAISDGVPPYSVAWSHSSVNTTTLTGLTAGVYIASITDASGCILIKRTVLAQPIQVTTFGQVATCALSNDAFVGASASSGVPPYTFLWSNNISNDTLLNLGNIGANYYVTVTDNIGQTASKSIYLNGISALYVADFLVLPTDTNANGSISLFPSGGNNPYSYQWSNGATEASQFNLAAGIYHVTISDVNHCDTVVKTYNLWKPFFATMETQSSNCEGTFSSYAKIKTINGLPPYTFLWENGNTTDSLANPEVGSLKATVHDANGTASVVNGVISAPPPPLTINSVLKNATNDSLNNGSITLNISGGFVPYKCYWNNGQVGSILTHLEGGNYSVTITDGVGCTKEVSFVIDAYVYTNQPFDDKINIYPNPTTGHFLVEIPEKIDSKEVFLYDLNGKLLKKWAINIGLNEFTLADFPSGNYHLKMVVNSIFEEHLLVKF
jgi:hypothetical protein